MALALESGIPFGVWAQESERTIATAIQLMTPKPDKTSLVKG